MAAGDRRGGGPSGFALEQHITANNGDAIEAMAVSGAQALRCSRISSAMRAWPAGRLVQVLPGWTGGTIGVHALYPGKLYVPLKVRSFIDWLAGLYRPTPPWHQAGQKKLGKSVSKP
jgi:DNA-binding transcriptional LysR family regulator